MTRLVYWLEPSRRARCTTPPYPVQVGFAEGFAPRSLRGGGRGARRPVDCRIVRRCNPIINLLFTPCTLKKKFPTFVEDPEGLSEHHPKSKYERPVHRHILTHERGILLALARCPWPSHHSAGRLPARVRKLSLPLRLAFQLAALVDLKLLSGGRLQIYDRA